MAHAQPLNVYLAYGNHDKWQEFNYWFIPMASPLEGNGGKDASRGPLTKIFELKKKT